VCVCELYVRAYVRACVYPSCCSSSLDDVFRTHGARVSSPLSALLAVGRVRSPNGFPTHEPLNARESPLTLHLCSRRTHAQPFRMCVGCRQVPSSLSSTADDHHLQRPPLWTCSRKMIRPTHQPFS